MVFTVGELIDLIIMTVALGYIFKDSFKQPDSNPLKFYSSRGFDLNDFWYACAVVAPSIILHEMAHKFTALSFGMQATFHAALTWLGIGVLLKVFNFSFIFFVPGYVSILGSGTQMQFALISFSGPLVHLILWLATKHYLDEGSAIAKGKERFLILTMQINKFLFILNMLPIPGFDGFSVYKNVLQMIV